LVVGIIAPSNIDVSNITYIVPINVVLCTHIFTNDKTK